LRNREITRREFIRLSSTGIAVATVGGSAIERLAEGESNSLQGDGLREGFLRPAEESRPWCYWYWTNGNVTREGIRADLEGLAEVGIGGVLLFDIGLLPAGKVINRSPEWYELVKFAVSEAAERNIKITLNCPGWSGSGGPWITPELAMQELTWSETVLEGEREFSSVLPRPPAKLGYYRDAAVIAFPTPDGDEPLPLPQAMDVDGKPLAEAALALNEQAVLSAEKISQAPGVPASVSDLEGGAETASDLPVKFDFLFPRPVEVRSLFVRGARAGGSFQAELFGWDDAQKNFRSIARFGSNSAGPFSSNIGSASFTQVRAAKFRLVFFEPQRRTTNQDRSDKVLERFPSHELDKQGRLFERTSERTAQRWSSAKRGGHSA